MPPNPTPTGARQPAFGRVLKIGSKGADVSAVKLALRAWRPASMSNTTDFFGAGMNRALIEFQRAERIPADGVYGPATHAKLGRYFDKAAAALYALASTPKLVQPLPKPYFTHKGEIHPTAGLDDYPAYDFFADAGSPIVAPEDGELIKFSGHDPAHGPVSGPHGPFGLSTYLLGASLTRHYGTHFGTRLGRVGDKVKCGQKIGTVGDYARWGGSDHVHWGVHGGGVSITELGNAPFASGA